MKILGFESSAKIASVALVDGERTLASAFTDNGLTQSELLLPMAEKMLSLLGLSFSDIDAFCTAGGPGSFTGVRIGIATVKGLAFGRGVPAIAVSSVEALAENLAGICGIVVPCMDARRNQVYTAVFRSDSEKITRLTPDAAISLAELETLLSEYSGEDIYIVGDGYELVTNSLRGKIPLKPTPQNLRAESAVSVCRVAKRKIECGEITGDLEIKPTYLRLPQAERERIEREKSKK